MKYFYDTEFIEDGRTIDLISIGIVAADGREYYAVSAEMPTGRISEHEWLMENVVPHLPVRDQASASGNTRLAVDTTVASVKPRWVIANEVRDFLTASGTCELWADHAAYDHVALAWLWGPMSDLPKRIPMYTNDIRSLMHHYKLDGGLIAEPENPDAHDALADARALRELHKRVTREIELGDLAGRLP